MTPMMSSLDRLSGADANVVGRLAYDLAKLHAGGVRVVGSVILSIDLFKLFQEMGQIPATHIDELLMATQAGDFGDSQSVIIHASTPRIYNGLDGRVRAHKTYASLKAAVERTYRSWDCDRARASRIINSIAHELSLPTLVVQPYFGNVESLITRNAVSGEPTTDLNFRDNINNSVSTFRAGHLHLVRSVDSTLRRPVKINFITSAQTDDLRVLTVTDEPITLEGRWRALGSYLVQGVIDELEYLRRIEPEMIGYVESNQFEIADVSRRVSKGVRGLPVWPGIVNGRLVFRDSTVSSLTGERPILLVDDVYPDDIHILAQCDGAIGLRGGLTSHLAAVCRGMKKPAVVGCDGALVLQRKRRMYRLLSGDTVPEFSFVLLDGGTGNVSFSGSPFTITRKWTSHERSEVFLDQLYRLISKFTKPDLFRDLAVDDQWHIAELLSRLRKVGRAK
jgi:hypothetical protein